MDRGQTFDVVDTPPPDRRDWPSLEDFQEREEIIKWHNIQPGTYKVLETHNQGRSKYGPSVVLKLEHKNGSTIFVWAPSALVYEMEKKKMYQLHLESWSENIRRNRQYLLRF